MQLFDAIQIDTDNAPISILAPVKEASFADKVKSAIDVIKAQIVAGKRCAVASSFGKDSSVSLALTLAAMKELKDSGIKVPELHVMNSNTRVENPVVEAYARGEIKKLKAYSETHGLPVRVWVCSPSLSNNYLVNILGGRTIASLPDNSAKCQQGMKAVPLERTKRNIAKHVQKEMGSAFTPDTLITIIGTRRDESAARGRAMEARGESALQAVNLGAEKGLNHWVLSPIADFSSFDVYELIGNVAAGRMETYSDFQALIEVYRDSAAGECMINLMLAGQGENKSACGARHGCWICLRVAQDQSMLNMLSEDSGKYGWMKPLNDFRNYIGKRHYDPSARNFLARTVNPSTGTIQISPNSYSPEFCLELLRYALSIDADEQAWAESTGNKPRFKLLGLQEVLAVDVLWARYAYQAPFQATKEYKDIFENGVRYSIPAEVPEFDRKSLDFKAEVEVPFADGDYNELFSGLRDLDSATADAERLIEKKNGSVYAAINTDVEFGIDEEGAHLFFDFELDDVLRRYGPESGCAPSAAVHVMARYGFLLIKRGGESEWDRMMRVGNQIFRHQLTGLLNKPVELSERLRSIFKTDSSAAVEFVKAIQPSANPEQFKLFL